MNVIGSYYLCLKKPRFINISEFIRIKDQEEIKEVEKIFNNESLSEIDKGIIIPMKYSHCIYFRSSLFDKAKVEELQKTIEVMSHIKDIQHYWDFRTKYDIVSKYLPSLPARTKYILSMNDFDLNTVPGLDEKLRMINWNEKRIYSIRWWNLSDENYSFVVFLLGIQKVQELLDSIYLKIQNLTSSLKIMELLRKCSSIDSIELVYSISDVDNEEEAIRESVQKLIKQVGLIKKIKIIKEMLDSDEY